MKSRWVEHKNKRVYISDFSNYGSNTSEVKKEADEIITTLTKEPHNSVLSIVNVDGTLATRRILQIYRDMLPHTSKLLSTGSR